MLAGKIFHREQLYSDFISESGRVLVDALEHNVGDPKNLIPAYALLSRIRLSFPRPILLLEDAKTLLGKRKLCPKNLCHLRGSPHKWGTNWEQNTEEHP